MLVRNVSSALKTLVAFTYIVSTEKSTRCYNLEDHSSFRYGILSCRCFTSVFIVILFCRLNFKGRHADVVD